MSTHPNQHDYDQLATIYGHLDTTTTVASSPVASANSPNEWGKLVSASKGGHSATYERDFGGGEKVITFVIWVR